jgi:hypothetical protein
MPPIITRLIDPGRDKGASGLKINHRLVASGVHGLHVH